ncbi:MAG: Kelch repeat-containing protein [Bacteroidota bacterium]
MVRCLLILLFVVSSATVGAQDGWEWSQLKAMPVATAQNAVSSVQIEGEKYIYSFGGISDSLKIDDIHQRVFCYDVANDWWSERFPVGDTLGKIGAAASTVNGKIYIMGGHHLEEDTTVVCSDKNHVYNPFIDTFEVDAAALPIPVTDHAQAVWRDSLIFNLGGWSNGMSIADVQIFNPSFNSWQQGTPVGTDSIDQVFGGAAYILKDTIYYVGGVGQSSQGFFETNLLRKGVIDPNDPTQIDWQDDQVLSNGAHYGAVCSGHSQTFFCLGGAAEAHDFSGMAYADSSPVVPDASLVTYTTNSSSSSTVFPTDFSRMGWGGIAKLGGGNWMLTGGIDSLQMATSSTLLLHNQDLSNINQSKQPPFFEVVDDGDFYRVRTENVGAIDIYNVAGQRLFSRSKKLADVLINKNDLENGMLLFVYDDDTNVPVTIKKMNF